MTRFGLGAEEQNTGDDQNGSDEVDKDASSRQFFAADFWPNESEKQAHKENDDWFGRVGGSRGEGDGWGQDKGGFVAIIFNKVQGETTDQGAKNFAVAGFINIFESASPFAMEKEETEIAEAFAENDERHLADKAEITGRFADKNQVADYVNEDIEEGVENGAKADFAAAFTGGQDNKQRGGNNNKEREELWQRDGLAKEEPAEDQVEDGGDLNENAKVGGIVQLQSLVVWDAGEAREEAGGKNEQKSSEWSGGKIQPKDEYGDEGGDNESDTEEVFLGDGFAALEIEIRDVIIYINARRIGKHRNNNQDEPVHKFYFSIKIKFMLK